MAYQVYFRELSFQRTKPDNPMVPVGDPVVVARGERVPAWVPDFQVQALAAAGMILPAADDPVVILPVPVPPDVPPAPPGGPDYAPPPVEPDDSELPPLPKDTDKKEAWETYAPNVGVEQSVAEAMTKTELMAEVKRRHAAGTN